MLLINSASIFPRLKEVDYENLNKEVLRCLLFGISLLNFIAFLDATIVSTALPAIQLQLSMSITQLQWIMNAFYLGCSALMASMGRVADIYGRRKVFYLGVLIFGFASISAGLAQNAGFLIFCRAIQGMMTAIIIPVGIALIQVSHEQNEISKAMGVFGMVTGLGLALGPVVGGSLVTVFGWPAIFFVNIPFIFIGFIFCFKTVKESHVSAEIRLDYGGVLFLTLTILSLVFGVVEGNNYGWHSLLIQGSLFIFLISLFLLIVIERRVKHSILAGYLFHNKIFVTTMVFAFLGGGIMGVVLFIDPLYLQVVLGFSDLMTGIYLFIISAVVMFGAYIVGHLNYHYGAKIMLIFGTLFYLVSIVLHMNFSVEFHPLLVLGAFIFMGLGWAIVNVVPSAALGTNIHGDHLAVAFGALFTFYNVASSLILS